ncbi:MAG: MATE family efflux transporter [Leadbetterella sp.]
MTGIKEELNKNLGLSIPIVISQLGTILMSVSDNLIVGRLLGKQALSEAAVGNSMAFLMSCIGFGGFGILAPLISKALAENNRGLAVSHLVTGNKVLCLLVVLLSLASWGLYLNFDILDQPKEIISNAKSFFAIISFSNIFGIAYTCNRQWTDGHGLTQVSMKITFFGLVSNIFFNYVFIEGWFGIDKLGVLGSALATLITRFIMLVTLIVYIVYKDGDQFFKKSKLSYDSSNNYASIFGRVVISGLSFFFEIGCFTFALVMMGWIDTVSISAHQIAISIASTTFMMAMGFAIGGSIRVGDAMGSQSVQRVRLAANVTYGIVGVFMSIWAILLVLGRNQIIKFYIDDPEVLSLAAPLLIVAGLFQIFDGMQVVGINVLRGIQDIKIPTIITFIAYWVISLPLGYFLAFTLKMGAIGIWYGLLFGLGVSSLWLFLRFKTCIKSGLFHKGIE